MQDQLKEKIVALLDKLPRCNGDWIKGSGGHSEFTNNCGKIAEWLDGNWNFCDKHLPRVDGKVHDSCRFSYQIPYVQEAEELLFAVQDRNIPYNAIQLDNYQRDNLLWLLTLVSEGYLHGTHTGDWCVEIMYKLSPSGKLTDKHRPNHSIQDYLKGIIKNIIE